MGRYSKTLQVTTSFQAVHEALSTYLLGEGYEYVNSNGESVFQKGNGWMVAPTVFKFTYIGNTVQMETWMRISILPFVYIGETTPSGFVGCLQKGKWKKRIAIVESILSQHCKADTANVTPQAEETATKFCISCGKKISASSEFCCFCGEACSDVPFVKQPIKTAPNYPARVKLSRKEFICGYAPRDIKNAIRGAAITCYVCAALTIASSVFLNPWGIIDALLLAGLALGMHLAYSRVCAILVLILSIIEVVASLVTGDTPPIIWLIAGIAAVVSFSKAEKRYKQYLKEQNL